MRALATKRVWYIIFSVLLLYATTGDFMATSVLFVDGHDCNHPWIRIEHKCVTKSADKGKEKKQAAVARPGPVATPPSVSTVPTAEYDGPASVAFQNLRLTATPVELAPLRC
jgi:hypothetical protein